ncbi:MAG: hypothetical protein MJ230_01200 [bacterium]|nr:hypothetical protein [bacterium]
MNDFYKNVQLCCEDSINQLLCLESIIKITKESCLEHESSAKYYNLPPKDKYILSEERNHYINMLDIALDKLNKVIKLNTTMETEFAEKFKNVAVY